MAVKLASLCLLALLGSPVLAQPYFHPNQKPKGGRPTLMPPPPPTLRCDVLPQYKIQCGLPGITASDCQTLNCCFDGQMCYYGRAVTLQCTKDGQFIVVIARDATLPHIDLQSIHFNGMDQSCQPVDTTTAFVIYQFPVTACGTIMTEGDNNVITYENRISSTYEVAIGPNGFITRDSQFDLIVSCRYTGTSYEALVIEVEAPSDPLSVGAPGPVYVELRLGNGQCKSKGCTEEDVAYSSFYHESDYPVTKVLRDPVYVEVRLLNRNDPNLVLMLGRCWASTNPQPDPTSYPQWDLLVDGCPYRDDRYQTALVHVDGSSGLTYPSHYRRFIFKMFTFVASRNQQSVLPGSGKTEGDMMPLRDMIYIHCETDVCRRSGGQQLAGQYYSDCEPRCFRRRRDVAAPEKTSSGKDFVTVSSPGIIFMNPTEDSQ